MLIRDCFLKILFKVRIFLRLLITRDDVTLDNYDEMSDDVSQRSHIGQRLGRAAGCDFLSPSILRVGLRHKQLMSLVTWPS